MSIYENGPKPKTASQKRGGVRNGHQADPKQILNKKDLTALVKQIKGGPKSAKELLYDTEKNVVGVLQRDDTPFFLTTAQTKELETLQAQGE